MNLKTKIDPDGYVNLWGPALAALAFFMLLLFWFVHMSTNQIEKSIQEGIDKKFEQLTPSPVYVPKLTPQAQAAIEKIEADRELNHLRVDNLPNNQMQSLLDSLFNNPGHPQK